MEHIEIEAININYLIIGIGVTGLSLIKYFGKKNINVFIYDDNEKQIEETLNKYKNTKFLKLEEYEKVLDESFVVFPSPGVPLYGEKEGEIIKIVKFNNCRIYSDIELFLDENPKIKVIAVSGTNGKTSMCHLIQDLLNNAGYKACLTGNIGNPILDTNIECIDFCIIEISSFQTELLSKSNFDIAIILNITNDHLDRHITLENYIIAKYRMLQNPKTVVICNPLTDFEKILFNSLKNNNKFNINEDIDEILDELDKVLIQEIPSISLESIYSLYALARKINISNETTIETLKNFSPLPHRIELVLENDKFIVFNDSKATNFHATSYALQNRKNIIWIGCGILKEGDAFIEYVPTDEIKLAIFFGQDKQIFFNFFKSKIKNVQLTETIETTIDCLVQFIENNQKSDKSENFVKYNIMFSPGGASFDMWKGYAERGDCFKKKVFDLIGQKCTYTT